MKIEVDNKIFGIVTGAVTTAFAVFFYMNSIHIENHELEISDSQIRQRILISESTRYAEIIKYYNDLEKERDLTFAEMDRKRIAEEQQCRIYRTLQMNVSSENFVDVLKDCKH